MVGQRGEVWWASLADPRGSEAGFRRPVLILQSDAFNRSRISTVVVAALSSNLDLAEAPGNVRLTRRQTRLPKTSVVNVSRVLTLDRAFLTERVGRIPSRQMQFVEAGLRLVLGL